METRSFQLHKLTRHRIRNGLSRPITGRHRSRTRAAAAPPLHKLSKRCCSIRKCSKQHPLLYFLPLAPPTTPCPLPSAASAPLFHPTGPLGNLYVERLRIKGYVGITGARFHRSCPRPGQNSSFTVNGITPGGHRPLPPCKRLRRRNDGDGIRRLPLVSTVTSADGALRSGASNRDRSTFRTVEPIALSSSFHREFILLRRVSVGSEFGG